MTSALQADPSPPNKGVYANYFEVGHTALEIVIHFGERYGLRDAPCHTRIVMSPIYAQALFATLRESLEQYAAEFGPPRDPGDNTGVGQRDEAVPRARAHQILFGQH